MTVFRRRLRSFAAAWLVFQAASMSALVPRACCLAHTATMATTAVDCHRASTEPHSMHHMHGATHQEAQPAQKPASDCTIRGTCGGPLAAMFAIFSTQGVLTERIESLAAPASSQVIFAAPDQMIGLAAPPNSPPPRS